MVFQVVKEFYDDMENYADPRTQNWAFVNSFIPSVASVASYFVFLYVVPKVMKKRAPLDLKRPMLVYNAATTMLNTYIFIELFLSTKALGYSYACQSLVFSYDPMELRVTSALWFFYISKIIEMADTVFFVLRKKDNQVSFLHVYHHCTMVIVTWIGIKWFGGGQTFFSCMLNSFVHIIMYMYYAMSAVPVLKKYLWWKKYLTQLQLTQFVSVIVQAQYAIYTGCVYPKAIMWLFSLYIFSFLLLFSNFYIKSYRKAKVESTTTKKAA